MAVVSLSVTLPQSDALISSIDHHTTSSYPDQSNQSSLQCQLEEAKLKIARLESIFEERTGERNAKSKHLRDCEMEIDELNVDTDRVKTVFSSFEYDHSSASVKLSVLEEEVS